MFVFSSLSSPLYSGVVSPGAGSTGGSAPSLVRTHKSHKIDSVTLGARLCCVNIGGGSSDSIKHSHLVTLSTPLSTKTNHVREILYEADTGFIFLAPAFFWSLNAICVS